MSSAAKLLLSSVFIFSSLSASAQSVDEVFDGLVDAELAGYESVENYLVHSETMGVQTVQFFERESSFEHNGKTYYVMRDVPLDELQSRQSPDNPMNNMSAEELRQAAAVIEQQGVQMEQALMQEVNNSGVGALGGGLFTMTLMNPPERKPWLSANPRDMTSMYATMLRGAADRQDELDARDPEGDARRQIDQMAAASANARIVGTQAIDGLQAIGLMSDDIGALPGADGAGMNLNSMTMWVDQQRFVPLRLRMEGEMLVDGQLQQVTIERNDFDYQQVAGCGRMLKPMRSVMSLGGMLTEEQQAEMAAAQVQLAEFEQQMAQMPEAQRRMIEQQMGPQMEMMRNMANGGGIQMTSNTLEIRCNTTPEAALQLALSTLPGAPPGGAFDLSALSGASGGGASSRGTVVVENDEALRAAQQACVEALIETAQAESQPRRRGFGGLLNSVGRAAGQLANLDISGVAGDLFGGTSTEEDLARMARELGIPESELAACQNPQ